MTLYKYKGNNIVKFYRVGGAVRDKLINFPSNENDWVVVGGSPKKMIELGFRPVGKDFPVFLHPTSKEEYALARTEKKTGVGYHGFTFYSSAEVTLEDDLRRRDLTMNAIAETSEGCLIDPFHGQKDIRKKKIRHVSKAFREDPVRVLRTARFAARYYHLGFSVAKSTIEIMHEVASSGELSFLVAERVWRETEKALGEKNPHIYFKILRECGALKFLFPELDSMIKIAEDSSSNKMNLSIQNPLDSLMNAAQLSEKIVIRFAATFAQIYQRTEEYDVQLSLTEKKALESRLADVCDQLKVPSKFRRLALIAHRNQKLPQTIHEISSEEILKILLSVNATQSNDDLEDLLICLDAITKSGHPSRASSFLRATQKIVANLDVSDIINLDLKGDEIGDVIRNKRLQAVDECKLAFHF
jgi:tRNA nucleotidyltransferase (CCA-adding enzyme)